MTSQSNHLKPAQSPQPMPVLPNEIVEMIFEKLEASVSSGKSITTVRPEWHASGSVQRLFEVNHAKFIGILNRHWAPISLVSHFWYEAVSARRHRFATTVHSSSALPPLTSTRFIQRKITDISARIDGDQVFSHIRDLNTFHPLESITLHQTGKKLLELSLQSWNTLALVEHLRELKIHQPLSIPLTSVLTVLKSCPNLQVLKLYSFEDAPSSQASEPPIGHSEDEEKRLTALKHLTCHFSAPWHPSRSCDPLVRLLRSGLSPLNSLTLVFENITPEEEPGDEDARRSPQANTAEGLLEAFGICRNLRTLHVAVPEEMSSLPFIDPIINNFLALEHLHLRGNLFSPALFTMNVLPVTLKTIDCQAYSGPILPLLTAIRNSMARLVNLRSLTITTYRRKPRNFTEALYQQLDLPLPTEEPNRDEPLSWDLTPTETLAEQRLLVQECQARSIELDGPRAYTPHK
ncbi:hypothetical protein MJO29_007410 [Puccinia striiformis f. sp. tritici]|uniref:Uncharacterized protein n=1 Tax=Puccinia striiformis f. sp. tritici PST-78 TaxID=1165861 RepID=A0A0L0VW79_9BASI|nr:hypothetical protein MJO29_007410 [Puccinia striiformis f. sp. tritici]KAI9603968.1 hypothetical protein H4Q26_003577 [Puccinia striiformis f. sp. tritici PST-130]KNF03521.1 hypothetical protein PSTG_03455 [Puccinia striiformis f. sp. tritici PST-78]